MREANPKHVHIHISLSLLLISLSIVSIHCNIHFHCWPSHFTAQTLNQEGEQLPMTTHLEFRRRTVVDATCRQRRSLNSHSDFDYFWSSPASFLANSTSFELSISRSIHPYPSFSVNHNFFCEVPKWNRGFPAKRSLFLRYRPRFLNQCFMIFDFVYIYILYGFRDNEKYCGLSRDHTVGTQIETLLDRGSNSESRTEYISELVLMRRF